MNTQQLRFPVLEPAHSPNTANAADTANLAMVAQHLNVSVGPVVHVCDLALALRSGSFRGLSSSDAAAAMLYLFVEISPSLIGACTREAGGSYASANQLYLETVSHGIPRVLEWEQAVEHLL
jgi:hypothetical protein